MNKKIKNRKKQRGFTLIEMLISISLFTIVVTIAFGALMTIMSASNKAKTIKIVVNNLNLAIESMSREIRTGSYYNCITASNTYEFGDGEGEEDCDLKEGNVLVFKAENGDTVAYYLNTSTNQIMVYRKPDGVTAGTRNSLTGDDVEVEKLQLAVKGTEKGDNIQPRVLLVLKGAIRQVNVASEFNIQTTISQRKIEP